MGGIADKKINSGSLINKKLISLPVAGIIEPDVDSIAHIVQGENGDEGETNYPCDRFVHHL